MKKSILVFIAGFSILVFFTTCKKYPEGGYYFNYLKKIEGTWQLKLYEVNGIDSTYLTQGANSIENYIGDFASFAVVNKGKRAQIRLNNHLRNYSVLMYHKKPELMGIKEGNNSSFDSTGCVAYNSQLCQRDIFNPTNEKQFNWKIEKLTKKELILISNIYNYKIILVK